MPLIFSYKSEKSACGTGRYLSRLFAIRERVYTAPSDTWVGDTQESTVVSAGTAPEFRWWIFSLSEQDETESLIAKLAAQLLIPHGVRVASAGSPVLFPYGFLTPRHRPPNKQPTKQVVLDASTVLQQRPCAQPLQWAHDSHGRSVFTAQEVLCESGSAQTRTVSVRFSATEGVVTAAVPEAKLSAVDAVPQNQGVVIGIFPMECIRAFECNSTKTLFRLHFHIGNGSDTRAIHGLEVDSVYFKTDQAAGMRQAMATAWSEAKSSSIEQHEEQRRQQRDRLRQSSESLGSPNLIAAAFAAWRDDARAARAFAQPSRGSFAALQRPEASDTAALYVQVVEFQPLPSAGPRGAHSRSAAVDAEFDTAAGGWQYQVQLAPGKQFFQSNISTTEAWQSPHVFTETARADIECAETDRCLCVHLCRCLADSDSRLLDERWHVLDRGKVYGYFFAF